MSKQITYCVACDPESTVVRDALGNCDECGVGVDSIDYLHNVGGKAFCGTCADKAGHFDAMAMKA